MNGDDDGDDDHDHDRWIPRYVSWRIRDPLSRKATQYV